MKINCLDKEVGQLLSEAFYKIPRFQRPYSWDRVNLEEFWNDVIVESEGDYFIGNFVVYDDRDVRGIVDGQQRLTTITLLLCALRDAFTAEGLQSLARGVHTLIERRDIKDQKFYVLRTETSYPYFQRYIQNSAGKPPVPPDVGTEERLLKEAFEYLTAKISEVVDSVKAQPNLSEPKRRAKIEAELSGLRDKVLGLKLILTALDNDDDAYIIFETLNTRGKDLTLSDLVKSHLSRLMKPTNRGVDLAKDKWAQIAETFEASQAALSVSTFIHHYWLSRYEYVTEKKLYKALRKRIKKDNAEAFLDDLVADSKIYRQIHEPSYRKWRKEELAVRDSLNAMVLFRIKQQLPMALSLLRHCENGAVKLKHVADTLRAIEDFHFAFTAVASERSSGGISFMYASSARNLHEAKGPEARIRVLREFQAKLASKRPPYAEFEARFLELRCSSKFTKVRDLVRYILTKVYESHSPGLAIDPEKLTIEHLAAESPPKGTELSDEQIASIGNLILVTQDLNNRLANKGFPEKRSILSSAKVWIDPVILEASAWGAAEIEQRAKWLADSAYRKVWKL